MHIVERIKLSLVKYLTKCMHSIHWVSWFCRVAEALRIPKIIDAIHGQRLLNMTCRFIWRILTKVDTLSEAEIKAAKEVFGPNAIRYDAVLVAEGRLLSLLFRINGNTAFTTLHSINLPKSGHHSRNYLDNGVKKPRLYLMVHELTHVYQFERIGSKYMFQSLRAQRESENEKKYRRYNYGGHPGLKEYKNNEWRFRFFNREQQAKIAQDYYTEVIAKELGIENDVHRAYQPFVDELRNGEL